MIKTRITVLLLALLSSGAATAEVDTLGRLFTTPAQRTMLQDLRNSRPGGQQHLVQQYEEVTIRDPQQVAEEDDEEPQPSAEELWVLEEQQAELAEAPVLEKPIRLKGVVSRKKGNHTVWINEHNSYEGGMMPENISVKQRDIRPDSVKVKLPGQGSNITLKVGETYAPDTLTE